LTQKVYENMKNYQTLVIFDLDGVLIDSRDMHFDTLNKALALVDSKYVISRESHLASYDGLSTTKKLEMLHHSKGLDRDTFDYIWYHKQLYTAEALENLKPDTELIDICLWLLEQNIVIAVASNAVRKTVDKTLEKLGIARYISNIKTNEDTTKGKPYPDLYWRAMFDAHAIPSTTIIIEDSHIGRAGAIDSGAKLLAVESRGDLTFDKIRNAVAELQGAPKQSIPWIDKKLNVVIPMAGAGSRFAKAGYTFPKPLIEVNGKPMIQVVVENLNIEANYIYIVQKEHYEKYHLGYLLNLITPGCKVVQIDGMTEGAACTVLKAAEYINNDLPLLIANSDQFMEWNSNECMYAFAADQIDGGILTFKSTHPKWSYVKLDDNGFVSEVAEKKVISDDATVGVYYWRRGSQFVDSAKLMIENDERVNGEFYVAPVYNYAIKAGRKIRIKAVDKLWGLGVPEDLDTFLREYKC